MTTTADLLALLKRHYVKPGLALPGGAKDFPVGTKLIIAADIELPIGYEPPSPPAAPADPVPAPRPIADAVDLDS